MNNFVRTVAFLKGGSILTKPKNEPSPEEVEKMIKTLLLKIFNILPASEA